jgi:CheY-like chemotaxis protein
VALRILLADDSMTAQNMGKKILTDAGFDVVTVSNGAAAVKKLAEASPDIAILDVYMPGYTGLEVCERMKSAPATARVPVLLSVGKMEPFRPEDGMKVKADGVIIKPFEATDLVTVVDKLAERAYGPDAKSTGVVPAEAEEADGGDQADVLEEAAPVKETTAEGLETFAPVADGGQSVGPEPDVEFTSAPKTGAVLDEPLDDLMPTVLQPEATQPEPAARAVAAGAETADDAPLEEVSLAPNVVQDTLPASAALVVADPAAAGAELSNETNWAAVESEVVGQDFDLDLEAEMQAVADEHTHDTPLAEPQHFSPAETGAPFLAPLGRTSFDELDAVMEQATATAEPLTPVRADENPAAAVAEDPEPESVLLSDDIIPDPLASDEVLVPLETDTEVESAIAHEVQIADAVPDESVLADENVMSEIEAAPAQESPGELLVAPEEATQTPLSPDATAEQQEKLSALSYYGLADEGCEESLHNPVQEIDEPFFAMADDAPVNAKPEDEQSSGITQPQDAQSAEPVCEDPAVTQVAEAPLLAEEIVLDQAPVAEPSDILEDVAATDPVLEEVATGGDPDAVPEAVPTNFEQSDPEPIAAAPMDEVVTPVAIPAPAVVDQPCQAVAAAAVAPAPAVDDAMVAVIVERVVDRVVDRLKPILVVMVEEILVELKRK